MIDTLMRFINDYEGFGSQLCITQVFLGNILMGNIPFNGLTLGSGFNIDYYINRGADKVVMYFLYTTNTIHTLYFDLKEHIKDRYPEAEEVEISVFLKKFSEAVKNPKTGDM